MSGQDQKSNEPAAFPFSPADALAFMQRMWNPLGVQFPGMAGMPQDAGAAAPQPFPNPAMMFAALDPAELDRKIGELRIIANWLSMSHNMVEMSIKTIELQKASLEALTAATKGANRAQSDKG
ncbi:MAG TPA: PhaM family polyhydroxyalkanoate granule multifunctional regulatory protein [Casimicrobiaceae bacterium]|nr:PhaM family polyhydroxyalkanoate granule multifunctional regulatory protein [Casimicrobiaceae bacterium]